MVPGFGTTGIYLRKCISTPFYACVCVCVCVSAASGLAWDASSCCCSVALTHRLSQWCHLLNALCYLPAVTVSVTAVSWGRSVWKIEHTAHFRQASVFQGNERPFCLNMKKRLEGQKTVTYVFVILLVCESEVMRLSISQLIVNKSKICKMALLRKCLFQFIPCLVLFWNILHIFLFTNPFKRGKRKSKATLTYLRYFLKILCLLSVMIHFLY